MFGRALLHQKQLHSIKKIPKQASQLHSTSRKIGSTLDFLEASQEMLHQIVDLVELGRITHHATGYVVLVLLQRKKKEKVKLPQCLLAVIAVRLQPCDSWPPDLTAGCRHLSPPGCAVACCRLHPASACRGASSPTNASAFAMKL